MPSDPDVTEDTGVDAPMAAITLARHDLRHPDGRAFHIYGHLRGDLSGQPPGHDVGGIHLRRDLLTDTWVGISPSRNTRPGGRVDRSEIAVSCPLCPGGLELPFAYDAAAFDNRFPALSPRSDPMPPDRRVAGADGRCQIVVYTSAHSGSLASLVPSDVARVVSIWSDRARALWADGHAYVMVFENHGPAVGATLSHPHGQIYALPFAPPVTTAKRHAHEQHRSRGGGCLSCVLVATDAPSDRVVASNDSFTVAVPFAARWPYEVHVRARRHGCGRLGDLTATEALDLARALREVANRYDGLFGHELPYMLCVQEAPPDAPDWHLHVELLPPHRDGDRLKLRASVETALGVFLNDTRPERSAERLAQVDVAATSWAGVVAPTIVPA